MRWLKILVASVTLGCGIGRVVAYFMAEHYWHNDGKTRAITFLYFEAWGLVLGAGLGISYIILSVLRSRDDLVDQPIGLSTATEGD